MVCFTVDIDTAAAAACVWWRRDKLTRCVSTPWSPGWTSRQWGRSPSSGRSRKCRSRLCRLPSSQPAFRSGRRRAPGHTPRWRKAPAKQARVQVTDGDHRSAPTVAPPWNRVSSVTQRWSQHKAVASFFFFFSLSESSNRPTTAQICRPEQSLLLFCWTKMFLFKPSHNKKHFQSVVGHQGQRVLLCWP